MIAKIVSGGQTGVDRARPSTFALELGVPCGGSCPGPQGQGRPHPRPLPPDGDAEPHGYPTRTRWNVRDSDFTLVLTKGEPAGGTLLTVREAQRQRRPHTVVDLAAKDRLADELTRVRGMLVGVLVLNVAGPRESGRPGVYDKAKAFLQRLLGKT